MNFLSVVGSGEVGDDDRSPHGTNWVFELIGTRLGFGIGDFDTDSLGPGLDSNFLIEHCSSLLKVAGLLGGGLQPFSVSPSPFGTNWVFKLIGHVSQIKELQLKLRLQPDVPYCC